MPKRPSENLARTQDGALYNKLQRPENWPVEPARVLSVERDYENSDDAQSSVISGDDEDEKAFTKRSKNHKRKADRRPQNANAGCLPFNNDEFSGSENDDDPSFAAMHYLKSVRAQADDLPQLHFAAPDSMPEDDHRGYFEDGAYTAAPQVGPELPQDYDDDEYWEEGEDYETSHARASHTFKRLSACDAYTTALLSKFHHLRDVVRRCKANFQHQVQAQDHAIWVPRDIWRNEAERMKWKEDMNGKPPKISALAATPMRSILALLDIVYECCLLRKQNISKNLSLWLLALMANIDEHTIDGDVMSRLRDLAKKAIWLRIDFEPQYQVASLAMGQEAGYLSDTESRNEDAGGAGANSHAKEDEVRVDSGEALAEIFIPDDSTKATLDMIVVIVGEIFGQKDLLESRSAVDWPLDDNEDVHGDRLMPG